MEIDAATTHFLSDKEIVVKRTINKIPDYVDIDVSDYKTFDGYDPDEYLNLLKNTALMMIFIPILLIVLIVLI